MAAENIYIRKTNAGSSLYFAINKNIEIALPKNNIYIIRCNNRTFKTSL